MDHLRYDHFHFFASETCQFLTRKVAFCAYKFEGNDETNVLKETHEDEENPYSIRIKQKN